jgi:hypothetical protein
MQMQMQMQMGDADGRCGWAMQMRVCARGLVGGLMSRQRAGVEELGRVGLVKGDGMGWDGI